MDKSHCQKVFDITTAHYAVWPPLLIGVALFAAGIVAAWYVRPAGWLRRWSLLAFAVVWLAVELSSMVTLRTLQGAVRRSEYTLIRGPITEYHGVPKGRTGMDWFVVNGHRFQLGGSLDPGYNQARRGGAILKAGDFVEIGYRGDVIVLVDLCDSPSAPDISR
jgi:hypothetical protein